MSLLPVEEALRRLLALAEATPIEAREIVSLAAADGRVLATDLVAGLDLPPWQPPTLAFPLVWTALYADIAVSSVAALSCLDRDRRAEEATAYRTALAANLTLNTAWSVLFWRARRLDLAAVEAVALAASSTDLARRVGRARGTRWCPPALPARC